MSIDRTNNSKPYPPTGGSKLLMLGSLLYAFCFMLLVILPVMEESKDSGNLPQWKWINAALNWNWVTSISESSPFLFGFMAVACAAIVFPVKSNPNWDANDPAMDIFDFVGRISALSAAFSFIIDQPHPTRIFAALLAVPVLIVFYMWLQNVGDSDILIVKIYRRSLLTLVNSLVLAIAIAVIVIAVARGLKALTDAYGEIGFVAIALIIVTLSAAIAALVAVLRKMRQRS